MKIRMIGLYLLCLIASLSACCVAKNIPAPEIIGPPEIQMAEVIVYFLDESRYEKGQEPYEVGVVRRLHPDSFLPRLALQAYFDGPTENETAQGLRAILSGCTGFSEFSIWDGIASINLEGPCTSGGSTYTIAQPIMKTLHQFPEIQYVKIYDEAGNTAVPFGPVNSIPHVLEP
jgi:hypothetical protein